MIGADVQILRFVIPGAPVGKGRPRATKTGQIYTPPETRAYEKHVQKTGRTAMGNSDVALAWPMRGVYHVTLGIFCGSGVMPDADNVFKAVTDGLTGVLWEDDNRVGGTFAPPQQSAVPRVEITVAAMESIRPIGDVLAVQVRHHAAAVLAAKPGSRTEQNAVAQLRLILASIGGNDGLA